jgi:hypothetical protein
VARAIDIAHLKVQHFVQAQPTAVDGGEVDASVQGGDGIEETAPLFQAEESRESVFRLGSNAVEGFPVTPKDVVGEESDVTIADAPGSWGEAIAIFSVQAVGLEFLFGDQVRRFAIELS